MTSGRLIIGFRLLAVIGIWTAVSSLITIMESSKSENDGGRNVILISKLMPGAILPVSLDGYLISPTENILVLGGMYLTLRVILVLLVTLRVAS